MGSPLGIFSSIAKGKTSSGTDAGLTLSTEGFTHVRLMEILETYFFSGPRLQNTVLHEKTGEIPADSPIQRMDKENVLPSATAL